MTNIYSSSLIRFYFEWLKVLGKLVGRKEIEASRKWIEEIEFEFYYNFSKIWNWIIKLIVTTINCYLSNFCKIVLVTWI